MPQKLSKTVAFLGALALVQASPLSKRDILTPLPENADEQELRFQPGMDYDLDGCYNTAAIDPSGYTNPGKGATGTPQGDCRDPPQLENSNVYSRKRCNNGICAIMYEYYYEKDQAVGGSFAGGHRHDWENVVVFIEGDNILRVSPSCHGGYPDSRTEFSTEGSHPLMVYHKDGAGTHCTRFANDEDLGNIENPTGVWFRSPLVGWGGWPSEDLKNTMLSTWSGGVGPKLDDEFGSSLEAAAKGSVGAFDPYLDE